MKILLLTPYCPLPADFGGAIRIYNILKQLIHHHDVTVAGYGTQKERDEMINEFPSLQGKVHFCEPPYSKGKNVVTLLQSLVSNHSHWYHKTMRVEMSTMLNRIVQSEDFDVVQSEFPVMANFNTGINAIKILDAHNVEYHNFGRMAETDSSLVKKIYYHLESKKFYHEEIGIARKQDAILTVSKRDAEIFDKDVREVEKWVIPNGVDLGYFQPNETQSEPCSMVFVGMMKYFPNEDAMRFFLDEVFPLIVKRVPNAKIYIVGGGVPKWLMDRKSEQIEVTGYVEDVRPYINKASVYVVPLRMGGGTRLKILEAMAMEKPMVTTSVGCEGIPLENSISALISDTAEEFAETTIELLQSENMKMKLTENALNLVQKEYSWDRVGEKLNETYNSLVGHQKDLTAINK